VEIGTRVQRHRLYRVGWSQRTWQQERCRDRRHMKCWRFVGSICRRRHVMSNPGSFKTLEAFRCHSIISESVMVTSATECDILPALRFVSIAIPDQGGIYLFHLPKSFDCMPLLRFRPQPSTSQYRRPSCHPLQPLRMADENTNLKIQQVLRSLFRLPFELFGR
jgi:hypothetical protein